MKPAVYEVRSIGSEPWYRDRENERVTNAQFGELTRDGGADAVPARLTGLSHERIGLGWRSDAGQRSIVFHSEEDVAAPAVGEGGDLFRQIVDVDVEIVPGDAFEFGPAVLAESKSLVDSGGVHAVIVAQVRVTREDSGEMRWPGLFMNERRARRPVIPRETGSRDPLTTGAFAPIIAEHFPLARLCRRLARREWLPRTPAAHLPPGHRSTLVQTFMNHARGPSTSDRGGDSVSPRAGRVGGGPADPFR